MGMRAGARARDDCFSAHAVSAASVKRKHVAIIGAPLDLGAGRRGVDMGPSAVRVAGLGKRLNTLGFDVTDLGNVPVTQAESVGDEGPADAKYLPQIAATCERLGELVAEA